MLLSPKFLKFNNDHTKLILLATFTAPPVDLGALPLAVLLAVVLLAPPFGIVTGTHPPKGPAFAALLHRTIQMLLMPAMLPVHFWSAATLAVRGYIYM